MDEINFKDRDIISIKDMTKQDLIYIIEIAKKMEQYNSMKLNRNIMQTKIMASLFFEPSTRTRLSFESAMQKLGGRVIGFSDASNSSFRKGETLKDTIKMVESYADVIVIRHPLEGTARWAAECSDVPVINAGDGSNQHPTQTLLDLYTIKKTFGSISGLKIALMGDLKYSRTIHSLAHALSLFNVEMKFVSPPELKMPKYTITKEMNYTEHNEIEEIISDVDVIYIPRIQKERFADPLEFERVKNSFSIKKELLKKGKTMLKIMSPLPRQSELPEEIDHTSHAIYFEQAANGIPVRQALLALCTGAVK